MAAKRKSASKRTKSSGLPCPCDNPKPSLGTVATALTEELAARQAFLIGRLVDQLQA